MAEEKEKQPADPPVEETHQEQGEAPVSLDALSRAFADLMDRGEADAPPATAEDAQTTAAPAEAPPPPPEVTPEEDATVTPQGILEAMLFVGNEDGRPIGVRQAAAVMRGVSPTEVHELVRELNAAYDASGAVYRVVSEGDGYRLALRPEFERLRESFYGRVKEARLSQAAIDVLSLVAYQQPITRQAVEEARGRPSGGLLSQLVRRKLLRLERHEGPPRTATYHTTDRFLALFGLSSPDELPQTEVES